MCIASVFASPKSSGVSCARHGISQCSAEPTPITPVKYTALDVSINPSTPPTGCTAHAWCCILRQTCVQAVWSASPHAMRDRVRLIRSRKQGGVEALRAFTQIGAN
jgi:hypothetical protein